MATNVLVVDDESRVRFTIKAILDRAGYNVMQASSGNEALDHLERESIAVALIDVKMAEMDGLELLQRVRARWPYVAVILITAYPSVPNAVSAMKLGASHYLEKNFTKETLLDTIKRAQAEAAGEAGTGAGQKTPFQNLLGTTPNFEDARDLARRSATTDRPVLLLGEIGTGRETFARAIHAGSSRQAAPFIPLRCAAAGLDLNAELFGTPGGSPGRLVEAIGGTLYLDGVEQLDDITQAQLLRYLQDGEFPRETGGPLIRSDARIIAGSTADLQQMVEQGSFRKDLFYALRAMEIRLPPLRERTADIPRLAQHFAKQNGGRGAEMVKVHRDAARVLASQTFPGNLKELRDIIGQAVLLASGGEITPGILEKLGITASETIATDAHGMRTRVEQEEKKAIEEELRRNPKNLKQTAQNLNISRTTLWRKMKKYGLDGE